MRTRARLPVVAAACAALFALAAPGAYAQVKEVQRIDGPSDAILELGGVAMAPDGTGGLVYRKRDGGRTHIFASRFDGTTWASPQRVDTGTQNRFDSSWPAIGAGNGGRLVVVWAQENGASTDRMFSASLDPGAKLFQAPLPVDLNIGEAIATQPSIAMGVGGQAFLVYRVVRATQGGSLPPGYYDSDLRVARYDGAYWSVFGQNADRILSQPVRVPDANNRPRIGIDDAGNGIVAWQEPDDSFIDRIYARRVFSNGTLGIPLVVSPATYGGKALRSGADAFSLDVAGFGEGAVAYRQQPTPGTAITQARVMVATIPEAFDDKANVFGTAILADGGGAAGPGNGVGPPSVGTTPAGTFTTVFGLGSATLAVDGDLTQTDAADRLDDGGSSIAPLPQINVAPSGAAVDAWRQGDGVDDIAKVRELGSDGVTDTQDLAAPAGGPLRDLLVAGSGLGDAAVAFRQGADNAGQIAAAIVDAPPGDFTVQTPIGFVRDRRVPIEWDPAPNALSDVTYTVTVDDSAVAEGLTKRRIRLGRDDLPDGTSTVQVVAVDGDGQTTTSVAAQVQVDRTKPKVRVKRRGRKVQLTLSDGSKSDGSGIDRASVRISFGDGAKQVKNRRSAAHRYRRTGTYRVRVSARDDVGNRLRTTLKVRVR